MAPVPAGAPSYVCFIAGSSFAHGFHASHLWKSFTCAKTAGAGAEMVAVRATRNSEGRVATIPTNVTTIPPRAMRILMSMVTSSRSRHRHAWSEQRRAHRAGRTTCESDGRRTDADPGDEHALRADAVGQEPADDLAAQRRETRHAQHGGRRHRRDALVDRVRDHVEDRPRVRGAAREVRERDDGELRRAQRLRDRELGAGWHRGW